MIINTIHIQSYEPYSEAMRKRPFISAALPNTIRKKRGEHFQEIV